jgi:AraC-like DNA-binding protein
MKIYIKNMVCIRCKMVVKSELEKLDIMFKTIDLGVVETTDEISQEKLTQLSNDLKKSGLELIANRKEILAEKIKTSIIDLVRYTDDQLKINLSDYLSNKLNYDYTYLANVFSEVKGISIEKFFIAHKIERVKELLIYHELNLKEISFITHYSSVAHLSNQFKKITGLAPSEFRHLEHKNRLSLEQVAVAV